MRSPCFCLDIGSPTFRVRIWCVCDGSPTVMACRTDAADTSGGVVVEEITPFKCAPDLGKTEHFTLLLG